MRVLVRQHADHVLVKAVSERDVQRPEQARDAPHRVADLLQPLLGQPPAAALAPQAARQKAPAAYTDGRVKACMVQA